ncbi:YcbK family protein [Spirabiliibacterium falconis]|uniref:YcbK family protein n=1 Tax=Spirabiliibacterium falconis TaxID=572023 RepID=UPI001AAD3DAE|nr:YcbK family protein [Spirabiliibacterium falconis]MBE2893690.1 YcbK family protein [Spirabiliibacterium falconis]
MTETNQQRRRWLALGGIVLGSVIMPTQLFAAVSTPKPRILRFRNINNGERLTSQFINGKITGSAALQQLNYFLRDRRSQQVCRMDPNLFGKFYQIQSQLGLRNTEIQIICGYRAPATNASMRRRSRGVAKNSYHTRGQAIDFRIDGISLSQVRKAAAGLNNGGVGYYPRSNFVHIDTGPVRTWRG